MKPPSVYPYTLYTIYIACIIYISSTIGEIIRSKNVNADFTYQGELICEVISEPGRVYIAECGGSDMRMVSNNKEAVVKWANDIYIGIIMSELDVQCAIKE